MYKLFTNLINMKYVEGGKPSTFLAGIALVVLTIFLLLELIIVFPVLFILVSIARIALAGLETFTCLVYDIKHAFIQYYYDMKSIKTIATKTPKTKE